MRRKKSIISKVVTVALFIVTLFSFLFVTSTKTAETQTVTQITTTQLDYVVHLPYIRSYPSPFNKIFEQELVALTNQERRNAGCPDVVANNQLTQATRAHSQDMALQDFFDHAGSDGASAGKRLDKVGYQWADWRENIAAGHTTPQAVITAWMASNTHKQNILNCEMREIGVGYYYLADDTGRFTYQHYWTQVFAIPAP